jgi:hypothetical protein
MINRPKEMEIVTSLLDPKTQDVLELNYRLIENSLTIKWFEELRKFLKSSSTNIQQRFYGFDNPARTEATLLKELNKNIDIINADGRVSLERISKKHWDQSMHNRVHHYFESLIGQTHNYTDYAKDSSRAVWDALGQINELTHEIEALYASDYLGAIHTSFKNKHEQFLRPHLFCEDDFNHFTMDWEWGDMVFQYCQIGKNWMDVFNDRDDTIFDHSIAPLKYFDGSFSILFFEGFNNDQKEEFYTWLKEKKVDIKDPKQGLGHIVCGKLMNEEAIKGKGKKEKYLFLGKYNILSNIKIKEQEKEIAQKSFN